MSTYAPDPLKPKADPNRVAVALKYDFGDGPPTVTAKGKGELAERIIATAQENNVAPTINSNFKSAELDVESWATRFTGESREELIYNREKLLDVYDKTKDDPRDPLRTRRGKLGPAAEFGTLPTVAAATQVTTGDRSAPSIATSSRPVPSRSPCTVTGPSTGPPAITRPQ